MVPNDTSGRRAGDGMMSCDVPGDGTHRGTFYTAFRDSHPGYTAQANGGHQQTHEEYVTHVAKHTIRG